MLPTHGYGQNLHLQDFCWSLCTLLKFRQWFWWSLNCLRGHSSLYLKNSTSSKWNHLSFYLVESKVYKNTDPFHCIPLLFSSDWQLSFCGGWLSAWFTHTHTHTHTPPYQMFPGSYSVCFLLSVLFHPLHYAELRFFFSNYLCSGFFFFFFA